MIKLVMVIGTWKAGKLMTNVINDGNIKPAKDLKYEYRKPEKLVIYQSCAFCYRMVLFLWIFRGM